MWASAITTGSPLDRKGNETRANHIPRAPPKHTAIIHEHVYPPASSTIKIYSKNNKLGMAFFMGRSARPAFTDVGTCCLIKGKVTCVLPKDHHTKDKDGSACLEETVSSVVSQTLPPQPVSSRSPREQRSINNYYANIVSEKGGKRKSNFTIVVIPG